MCQASSAHTLKLRSGVRWPGCEPNNLRKSSVTQHRPPLPGLQRSHSTSPRAEGGVGRRPRHTSTLTALSLLQGGGSLARVCYGPQGPAREGQGRGHTPPSVPRLLSLAQTRAGLPASWPFLASPC